MHIFRRKSLIAFKLVLLKLTRPLCPGKVPEQLCDYSLETVPLPLHLSPGGQVGDEYTFQILKGGSPLCVRLALLCGVVHNEGEACLLRCLSAFSEALGERHLTENSWHVTGATDLSFLPLGTSWLSKRCQPPSSQKLDQHCLQKELEGERYGVSFADSQSTLAY